MSPQKVISNKKFELLSFADNSKLEAYEEK